MKKDRKKPKSFYGKIWHFLWHDDSFLSLITLLALSFILIKFLIYPGLGLILGTKFPIVAVISGSMDHNAINKEICGNIPNTYSKSPDNFWQQCGQWYENKGIQKDQFKEFPLSNGFSRGDIIILKGKDPKDINIGDIIVFRAQDISKKPDPIIHRVVQKDLENGNAFFQTKGDHNSGIWQDEIIQESRISDERVIGAALFKIPWLGFVKIYAVELFNLVK